jgi:hypothetical protein
MTITPFAASLHEERGGTESKPRPIDIQVLRGLDAVHAIHQDGETTLLSLPSQRLIPSVPHGRGGRYDRRFLPKQWVFLQRCICGLLTFRPDLSAPVQR